MPANAGRMKRPEPLDRGGWSKRGKRVKAKAEQPAAVAE
jgi:hypothetical protein